MIELPEAVNIAKQLNITIKGKQIARVTAGHTPHKLVWYYGDQSKYPGLVVDRTIGTVNAYGSLVEIKADNACILVGEGIGIRFHREGETRPAKHQMLIEFGDGCALSGGVQMYGGWGIFREGELDNPYYKAAKERPSPLSTAFDQDCFMGILSPESARKLSLKAVLATGQRIPGLGNGVLQDILFNAKMHPRKKVNSLSEADERMLYESVKTTLRAMADAGGRDTELDLFGQHGGYRTILSRNSAGKPCPVCGTIIKKEAYMGGSVYFCEKCQRL